MWSGLAPGRQDKFYGQARARAEQTGCVYGELDTLDFFQRTHPLTSSSCILNYVTAIFCTKYCCLNEEVNLSF